MIASEKSGGALFHKDSISNGHVCFTAERLVPSTSYLLVCSDTAPRFSRKSGKQTFQVNLLFKTETKKKDLLFRTQALTHGNRESSERAT